MKKVTVFALFAIMCLVVPSWGQNRAEDQLKEAGFDQHIIQKVHQTEFMSNIMKRHFPDYFPCTVCAGYKTFRVGLDNSHFATGKVGQQYTEGYGNQQKRFVMFDDSQIEQYESQCVHNQELRFRNYVAEGSHFIKLFQYIHYFVHSYFAIFMITSSSSTLSPELTTIAVIVPSNSARMAL